MQTDTQQQSHHLLGTITIVVATGFTNALAWAQSMTAGGIATALTVVGGGLVGLIVLALQRVGPAWIEFKVRWDDAKNKSLSGKMDKLTEALDEATRREASARQLAADAKELADINRRIVEKSDRVNQELKSELQALRDSQSATLKRLEDANEKLHKLNGATNAIVLHNTVAEQTQDAILEQVKKNASLTTEATAKVSQVDDKAAHVVEAIDTLVPPNSEK